MNETHPHTTRSHLAWGWVTLCVFIAAGLTLEVLHAFKVGLYLDVGNETRRLLWRLAHAHGALLGLLHLAFAATAGALRWPRAPTLPSRLLKAATVLLPGGFFLGGITPYGGDPGIGVLLTPLGGLALLIAVGLAARASLRRAPADSRDDAAN